MRLKSFPFFLYFLITLLVVTKANSQPQKECNKLGTFYQPLIVHSNFSEGEWDSFATAINQAKTKEIFIQWSYADGVKLFDTKESEQKTYPINKLFDLAKKHGYKIWLGLVLDKDFWQIHQRNDDLLKVYFRRNEMLVHEITKDLKDIALNNSAFAGWYISEEIDDARWLEQSRTNILIEHLNKLSTHLKTITPNYPIAISGFANGETSPIVFADFCYNVISKSNIDFLLFQDGIGAKKLTLKEFTIYRDALVQRINPKNLRFIIEAFAADANDKNRFSAMPANPDNYVSQFQAATYYRDASSPIIFSVPDFMNSSLVKAEFKEKAQKLMETHKTLLNSCY